MPLVSTLPVEASLTVVPVLVASTSSSLTGVTVMLKVPLVLVPCAVVDAEVERVAGRLAAVVVVGDQAAVDVGLREGVADAQGRAAQPQRAVAGGRGDGVDQLRRRVVDVGGLEHAAGEHVAGRSFVDRGAGVGGQDLFVVDGRDRDVEGAAGARALAVVDAEVEASLVVSLPSWS